MPDLMIWPQFFHKNFSFYKYSYYYYLLLFHFRLRGGELFDFISEKERLSEEEASNFIQQILLGLKHMHSKHIAHLDLKPENIMLKNPDSHHLKLIDFGLSRKIKPGEEVREMWVKVRHIFAKGPECPLLASYQMWFCQKLLKNTKYNSQIVKSWQFLWNPHLVVPKSSTSGSHTRGDVSYEFFFQSGDMSNLAIIGAKNLNF